MKHLQGANKMIRNRTTTENISKNTCDGLVIRKQEGQNIHRCGQPLTPVPAAQNTLLLESTGSMHPYHWGGLQMINIQATAAVMTLRDTPAQREQDPKTNKKNNF